MASWKVRLPHHHSGINLIHWQYPTGWCTRTMTIHQLQVFGIFSLIFLPSGMLKKERNDTYNDRHVHFGSVFSRHWGSTGIPRAHYHGKHDRCWIMHDGKPAIALTPTLKWVIFYHREWSVDFIGLKRALKTSVQESVLRILSHRNV